jgi:tetratricopeptide (TPR) repeat protein
MPETESPAPPGEIVLPAPAAPPESPSWASWLAAHPRETTWILAGLALLLRLVYIFRLSGTPFYRPDRLDPLFYFSWAREIAAGHWIGDKIFVQSPLYAYLVAILRKILGERWIFPLLQIAQALLGVGTCLLTVRIGRRVLGETEAWIGGFLVALYGPFLFYEGMVMKTFLSTFLTVYLVDLLLRSEGTRRKLLLLAGFVFALTALVRDNFVLLFPLLVLGICLAFPSLSSRARLRAALLFTLGAAAGIFPVTLRNYYVGREFALLTTGGGEVFYIGNNADANGRYLPPPFVHADPLHEHDDFIAKASELAGRKLTPGESSSFWLRQGLSWIASSPGAWMKLLVRKLIVFWNYYELPDNYNYYEVRQVLLHPLSTAGMILYLPLTLVTFSLAAPLGLLGMALTGRRWRQLLLIYLLLFGYMGTVLLFFNFSRFRVPIVPFLCLFAGAALLAAWREAGHWGRYLLASGKSPEDEAAPARTAPDAPWARFRARPWLLIYPLLFLLLLGMVNLAGTGGRGVFPALQTELSLGDAYRQQKRFAEAEREYRQGLQILGDEPLDAATAARLGVDPTRMRQEVESERMAQGVNFNTVRAGLHFGLGALWFDRGTELLATDRGKGEDLIRRGVTELETAAKTVPYPPFLRKLAEAYAATGKEVEAEKTYRGALLLAPDDFGVHYDLAGFYYDRRRFPDALAEMQEAKKAKKRLTSFELADYHFGMGLVRLDGFADRERALYHFQQAVAANPDHREAKRIRELIGNLTKGGFQPVPED